MKAFTYRNTKTGKLVQSDKPLKGTDLVLVTQVRNGQMKSGPIRRK